MSIEQVVPGVYQVPLGMVNVFFLDQDGVTIIDSGMPGSAPKILDALSEIGRGPKDVRQILVTHLHADHTGSVKALKNTLGAAPLMMHAEDAKLFQQGQIMRPTRPAPGLLGVLIGGLIGRMGPAKVDPVSVDGTLADGDQVAHTGGLRAVYVPGHTAGHLAFFWPNEGGVLFTGDACSHMRKLSYPFIFEDFETGKQSLHRLAGLTFETALFSHGKPIKGGASEEFRRKWG